MRKKIVFWLAMAVSAFSLGALGACGGDKQETDGEKACKHDYKLVESEEATCVDDGYKVFLCEKCDDSYTETVAARGYHDFGDWTQTKDPTCEEDGEKTRQCVDCFETEIEYIDSLPHDYEELTDVSQEPTCTKQGFKTFMCMDCEDTYSIYSDALGHTPEGDGVVTEAKCLESGYTTYFCSVCKEYYEEEIPATGHNYEKIDAVAATCDNFGYEVLECEYCGDVQHVYSAQKLEHKFVGDTCTECKQNVKKALLFNTKDGKDFSFVEKSEQYGYLVHAIDFTYAHQLIVSRPMIEALLSQSITGLKIEFGCTDTYYRSFGLKTKGMLDYEYYNVFQVGFGGTAKYEVEFAPNGVLDEGLMSEEGLVLDIVYREIGLPDGTPPAAEGGIISDYLMSIGFNISYNKDLPATWFDSELGIVYDGTKWVFSKYAGNLTGYVNAKIQAGTIAAYMAQGYETLDIVISAKPKQSCAISVDNDKHIANMTLAYTIELTEELAKNGYVIPKLYISDTYASGAWGATEPCNGFNISLTPKKPATYADKATWIVADESVMKVAYADNVWTTKFVNTDGTRSFTIDKNVVNAMIEKGITSVTLTISTKEGEWLVSTLNAASGCMLSGDKTESKTFTLVKDSALTVTFYTRALLGAEIANNGFEVAPPYTGFVFTLTENAAK